MATVLHICFAAVFYAGLSSAQTACNNNLNFIGCQTAVLTVQTNALLKDLESAMRDKEHQVTSFTNEAFIEMASRMNHTKHYCHASDVFHCYTIPARALITRAVGHFGSVFIDQRLKPEDVKKLVDCNQQKEWLTILNDQMESVIYEDGLRRPNTTEINHANMKRYECRIYNQFVARVSADSIGQACGDVAKNTFAEFSTLLGQSYHCSGAASISVAFLVLFAALSNLIVF